MTEQEKHCTLVFDELKIKNFLEYSKYLDLVEGYEDLGPKGRTNNLAGRRTCVKLAPPTFSNFPQTYAIFLKII